MTLVGPHRSRRRRTVVAAAAILGSIAAPLAPATAAYAAGSSDALGTFIVASPEHGWPQDSPAAVQTVVDRLEKIDSNAVNGESVPVAAKAWHSPGGDQVLAITLSRWPSNAGSLDNLARVAINDECVAVSGDNPTSVGSVPNLDGSLATTCTAPDGSTTLVVADAPKGNVLEMVESIGIRGGPTLAPSTVGGIAAAQFDALPAVPNNVANLVDGIIGSLVTIAVAVGAVLLGRRAVRRRRQRRVGAPAGMTAITRPYADEWSSAMAWPSPAVAPGTAGDAERPAPAGYAGPGASTGPQGPQQSSPLPPLGAVLAPPAPAVARPAVGWHPVDDSPTEQRYWDGAAWTHHIHWDGSSWIREPRGDRIVARATHRRTTAGARGPLVG